MCTPSRGWGRRPSSLGGPPVCAPPALGGDADPTLWVGPLCVHPQPWVGTQALLCELTRHWVTSSGAAPQPRGSWASQALHKLFLKLLPLAWLPAPHLAPSLKPGACDLAVSPLLRPLYLGPQSPQGLPCLSALSPLREPPFPPLGGLVAVLQAQQSKVGAGERCGPGAQLPRCPLQSLGRQAHRALPGRGGALSCSPLSLEARMGLLPSIRRLLAPWGQSPLQSHLPGPPVPLFFWQVSASLLSVV